MDRDEGVLYPARVCGQGTPCPEASHAGAWRQQAAHLTRSRGSSSGRRPPAAGTARCSSCFPASPPHQAPAHCRPRPRPHPRPRPRRPALCPRFGGPARTDRPPCSRSGNGKHMSRVICTPVPDSTRLAFLSPRAWQIPGGQLRGRRVPGRAHRHTCPQMVGLTRPFQNVHFSHSALGDVRETCSPTTVGAGSQGLGLLRWPCVRVPFPTTPFISTREL